MNLPKIAYKSYCWSIGTTSYRTKKFNFNIEKQLALLNEFWSLPENNGKGWPHNNELQSKYYRFIQSKGFLTGDAPRPFKDAREKTSGLVDIGLVNKGRLLTEVGNALLKISTTGEFKSNNSLYIPEDSYIYLKQLLKMSVPVDNNNVRPFILLVYFIIKFGFLSKEEYSYILPLCIDEKTTEKAISDIPAIRSGKKSIDDFIVEVVLSMPNYQEALELLLKNKISEDLIITIGMNRKSRAFKAYDKAYFTVYELLKSFILDKKESDGVKLFLALKNISGKASALWKSYLFNTSSLVAIKKDIKKTLNKTPITKSSTEETLKKEFFKLLHLFKIKANLSDYLDLNRRYFKLTDTILFAEEQVKLDTIPFYFFQDAIDDLYKIAFIKNDDLLTQNCAIESISQKLIFDEQAICQELGEKDGQSYSDLQQVVQKVQNERLLRFQKLMHSKFNKDTLCVLLEMFENRTDSKINALVTDNADIPTIFEYILAIIWYIVSEEKGNILEYMNLSLDADLLPKTHAAGGGADIVYQYEKTDNYPHHTLLIEGTLTNNQVQRRAEMEPVSRHLGDYMLGNSGQTAYCLFASTYLDLNVISDFRSRKSHEYYGQDERSISSMKIIPLQTSELKTIINKDIKYKQLYQLFETAYQSTEKPNVWYKNEISDKL